MSALELSRLQFALTAVFHFMFVVMTLGFAPIIAFLQTRWAITGNEIHERLTRFWGQIYIVNYAVGIVIGLVLEFQFGLHWSGLVSFAGEVFGAPLAMETLVAFFLESTFLGLWIFGWGRLNRWVHTALFWLVMITGYLSAFWVMVANGFLQEPVGHVVENGVARIHDLGAVLTNPHTIGALWHIAPAALLTAAVVMLGISSWHLLRSTGELDFFRRSVRVAVITGSVAAPATVALGGAQFSYLTEGKLLALGGSAAERASHQADMAARYGPGDWTPPTWISFAGPVMIVIGVVLSLVFFALIVFLPWNAFDRARPVWLRRFWHRVYVWMIPLPFLAVASGWLVREVGRQPWLVTGELTVEAAVAPNSAGQVLFSLVAFGSVFVSLALIDWWLIARLARRGPTRMMLGTDVAGSDIVGSDSDLADAEHGDRPAGRLLSATAQVKGG